MHICYTYDPQKVVEVIGYINERERKGERSLQSLEYSPFFSTDTIYDRYVGKRERNEGREVE